MAIDVAKFRETMGLLPGAVTLITTGSGATRRGITATAVCSVSDAPPSLLVCVNNKTGTAKEIAHLGQFSVQFLAHEQTDIALAFAGATGKSGAEKFDTGQWTDCPLGLPRLQGALASVSCQIIASTNASTHTIFVGEMVDVDLSHGNALLYAGTQFFRLGENVQ